MEVPNGLIAIIRKRPGESHGSCVHLCASVAVARVIL